MRHIFITLLILLSGCVDEGSSTKITPCDPNPCIEQNRTICTAKNGEAICSCDADYQLNGNICKKNYVDPCTQNSCSEPERTICSDLDRDEVAECDCIEGYTLIDDLCVQDEPLCITFRVMAANLTSGKAQSYDPGHGIRIFQGLKPDLVMIQEFNYKDNTDLDLRSMVNNAFGTDFHYSRGSGDHQIPNGIISRWPVVETGYWDDPAIDNRDLHWGIIDLPTKRDLFVISVHLKSGSGIDQQQAATIISNRVNQHRENHPGKYLYMVGGDFNGAAAVTPDHFGKAFIVDTPSPTGIDDRGEENPNTNRSRTVQLDWILFDSNLQQMRQPLIFTDETDQKSQLTYENGLVFDSRSFTEEQLEHYFAPVLQSDSDEQFMQHMGVIQALMVCDQE